VLAVEHVVNAGEPGLHHRRRRHAVARAHSGKVERLLDVILVASPAPEPGDLLRRIREANRMPFSSRRASDAAAPTAPNVALVPSALRCVPRT
jgi:hypothetical protein